MTSNPGLKVFLAVVGGFGSSGSTNLIASETLGINAQFNHMNDGDNAEAFYRDIVETGGGMSGPVLARVVAENACGSVSIWRGRG